MTLQKREIYRSAPNGDRWSLVRETASERVTVEHEPKRLPAVKRPKWKSGTSSCTAGMGPSIRPCCGLSEHWSRSLLRTKEPGKGRRRERANGRAATQTVCRRCG
jgi:hypothetical protein